MSKAGVGTPTHQETLYIVSKDMNLAEVICENGMVEFECRGLVTSPTLIHQPRRASWRGRDFRQHANIRKMSLEYTLWVKWTQTAKRCTSPTASAPESGHRAHVHVPTSLRSQGDLES